MKKATLLSLLAITLFAPGCVTNTEQYHDDTEVSEGPGLFTGQEGGEFTITWNEDKKRETAVSTATPSKAQGAKPTFQRMTGSKHRSTYPQYPQGHKSKEPSKCFYDQEHDAYFCSY